MSRSIFAKINYENIPLLRAEFETIEELENSIKELKKKLR